MTTHAPPEPLDKRQAILVAARDLFADQGYEETTIAMIAHRAGMAVGTVYLYFQNKHDILVDVCLDLNASIMATIRSPHLLSLPQSEMPRAIIEAVFRTSRERMRYMLYYQVEAQSDTETQRVRASKQAITDALEEFLRQIIAQGQMAPFDTATYAAVLIALVSATVHQCFTIEQGERESFYREGVVDLIERLFFGPPLVLGGDNTSHIPNTER
jgi:AcrR family transcriptional regulator